MEANILLLANYDSVLHSIRSYKNPDNEEKDTSISIYEENKENWNRLINTLKLMYLIGQPIAFMDNMLIDSGMLRFSSQTNGEYKDFIGDLEEIIKQAKLHRQHVYYIYDNRILPCRLSDGEYGKIIEDVKKNNVDSALFNLFKKCYKRETNYDITYVSFNPKKRKGLNKFFNDLGYENRESFFYFKDNLVKERLKITLEDKGFYRSASYKGENDWIAYNNYDDVIKNMPEEKDHLDKIQGLINDGDIEICRNSCNYKEMGNILRSKYDKLQNDPYISSHVKSYINNIFKQIKKAKLTRSYIYNTIDNIINCNPKDVIDSDNEDITNEKLGKAIKKILINIPYCDHIKYTMDNSTSESHSPHKFHNLSLTTFLYFTPDDERALQILFTSYNKKRLENIFGTKFILDFDSKNELMEFIGITNIEQLKEIKKAVKLKINFTLNNKKTSRVFVSEIFNNKKSSGKSKLIIGIIGFIIGFGTGILSSMIASLLVGQVDPQYLNHFFIVPIILIALGIISIVSSNWFLLRFFIYIPLVSTKWKKLKEDIYEILECSK